MMADYSRIDTMVRATVLSNPKKIAICPFAEDGMLAKQILNQRYGIEETYIVDNRLAEINDRILSVSDLQKKDTTGLTVLLVISNREINRTLENQIMALGKEIEIQNYLRPTWMMVPSKKDYFKELRSVLQIQKPLCNKDMIRIGKKYDGGYVLLNDFSDDMHVYSFGIAQDVSFEKELANNGLQIYMHDHTIPDLPEQHPNFDFNRVGISHIDEPENHKLSMKTLLEKNGDLANDNLILKMDVEGAEWDFIANTSSGILNQFRQITFELHRLTDIANREKILGTLNKLNETHQAVWIHANNFGQVERARNIEIPAYIEITYLNKSKYKTVSGSCHFPLDIDMPDCPYIEEYDLGNWGIC